MNTLAAVVDVPAQETYVRDIVARTTTSFAPAVRWLFSAHGNERFPLRFYASARCGEAPEAHDALVIAVEMFNPVDGQGDRLIVSADIMDDEGVILQDGPRYEVPLPSEMELLRDPDAEIGTVAQRVRNALDKLDQWLDRQKPMIQAALAKPPR